MDCDNLASALFQSCISAVAMPRIAKPRPSCISQMLSDGAAWQHGLWLPHDHLWCCAQKLHWDTADEKHWKDLSLPGT